MSGQSNYAIWLYQEVEKAKERVEKLEQELNSVVARLSTEDFGQYVDATSIQSVYPSAIKHS